MGVYRINYANGMFPLGRGAVFEAADGPSLRAGVRSGVLSRMDWEPAPVDEPEQVTETGLDQGKRPDVDAEAVEVEPEGEGKQEKPKKGK